MGITRRPTSKKGTRRVSVPTATPTKVKSSIKKRVQKVFSWKLPKLPGPDALAIKIERAIYKRKRARRTTPGDLGE